MAYNSGSFTLFNQSQNLANLSADQINPIFAPPTGILYSTILADSVTPQFSLRSATVSQAYGQKIAPSLSASGVTVSNAYGLSISGINLTAGTLLKGYSLFVTAPTGAKNNYAAYFALPSTGNSQGGVGIGTTTPRSALDVGGAVAIGSYAGVNTLSANILAVSGGAISVGVGTSTPRYFFDTTSSVNAQRLYGWMPQGPNQTIALTQGYSQGGFGGGSVGGQKTLSPTSMVTFDTAALVNSFSKGFKGAVFDGRYLYYVPNSTSATTASGQITRFDTSSPFNASASYAFFDAAANINSICSYFNGGSFDGRYIYFTPQGTATAPSGLLLRYDTALPFLSSISYQATDTSTFQANSKGFFGSIFDGRYLYLVPNFNGNTVSGQITRYDTKGSFTVSASYTFFDLSTALNSLAVGFAGGTYDGRYVYFAPNLNQFTYSGLTVRYDTSSSFSSGASYSFFDTALNVNQNSVGFQGAIYDGRYVYFVPYFNKSNTFSGQITRYDTSVPFTSASSYGIFNTKDFNSLSSGFYGGCFDGRYVYFVSNLNNSISGRVIRLDTTQSFFNSTSYLVFNATTGNSLSQGFTGAITDGRYVYLSPFQNNAGFSGQMVRLDAYSGPNPNAITTQQVPNSFAIGAYAGLSVPPSGSLIASGNVGIGTSNPQNLLDVNGSISAQYVYGLMPQQPNQTISLAQGPSQGGVGGGSVGTQKVINTNLIVFRLSQLSTFASGISSAAFDGTYVYFLPAVDGRPLTRLNTNQPFSSSTSYALTTAYYSASLNNAIGGGAIFDGRYLYFPPSANGQFTRYDTNATFGVVTSYTIVDLTSIINTQSQQFYGGAFDGKYVYLAPSINGQIVRYDTTGSFIASSSYLGFDTTSIATTSGKFKGAVYDGRYVYFVPNGSLNSQPGGIIAQYDTTLPFGITTSFTFLNLQTINPNFTNFIGAIFDGRFIYYLPNVISTVVRFDTTGSFISPSSYTSFDTSVISSLSKNFYGGVFDGRYAYFLNGTSTIGLITRFDTSTSFSVAQSYVAVSASVSATYRGAVFDGRYIYAFSGPTVSSAVVRIDAYPGSQVSVRSVSQIPSSFAIGDYAGFVTPPTNSLILSGGAGFGTANPSFFVDVAGSVNAQYIYGLGAQAPSQTATLAQGYNQGGFGGGLPSKIQNRNSIFTYNPVIGSATFSNSTTRAFDGRYIYFGPGNGPYAWRYDTSLPFNATTSYSVADTTGLPAVLNSINGNGFDGRYIYYGSSSNFYRYDTTLPFNVSGFNSINLIAVAGANGTDAYKGLVYDGRYMYMVPAATSFNLGGTFIRYDTTAPFSASTSYSSIDLRKINTVTTSFQSGVYDGRYVYLVTTTVTSTFFGNWLRYDTFSPFGISNSYATFNLQSINTNFRGFTNPLFDGRYVYLLPGNTPFYIVRYDTLMAFTSAPAYSAFDYGPLNSGGSNYGGAYFDGRYIVFLNFLSFLRNLIYDVNLPFTNLSSYSTGSGGLFSSSVIFDGRAAYAGYNVANSVVARLLSYCGPQTNVMATQRIPSNGFAVGTFVGVNNPSNGNLLVSGGAGIGTSNPSWFTDAAGSLNAQYVYGFGTYGPKQTIALAEGYAQGGLGGGSDGSLNAISSNSIATFDVTLVNSFGKGFQGALFDGRYTYFIPYAAGTAGASWTIFRYDTTLSYSSTASYSFYYMGANAVDSNSFGFSGGSFDGRYIYLVPNSATATNMTQYDTTAPFQQSNSYVSYNLVTNVNTLVRSAGSVYDGRYLYLIPAIAGNPAIRYDTTGTFNAPTSYNVFNLATVVSFATGFTGGTYDGRYVYYAPSGTNSFGGQIVQYDTTLPFTASSSYAKFDGAANINSLAAGYQGSIFDGRYVYFIPSSTFLLVRYDTVQSFSASTSYSAIAPSAIANTTAVGFFGAIFDGRYVYFVPNSSSNARLLYYDTTQSFSSTSSYTIFNLGAVNTLFVGGVYDGRYVYLAPGGNGGSVVRLNAYSAPAYNALAPSNLATPLTSLAIGYSSASAGNVVVSGSVGIGTVSPSYPLQVVGSANSQGAYGSMPQQDNQTVVLAEGYSQGAGFGGGLVGSNKTMSANTTSIFDMRAAVNSNSVAFQGAVFDGRYVYFVPNQNGLGGGNGQISRYDTQLPFGASASYSIFDMSANVSTLCNSYNGGVFDGRYVYFTPSGLVFTFAAQFVRFDTTLPFSSSLSYAIFDPFALNTQTSFFYGGVFDGKYVYYVPGVGVGTSSGLVVRYDSTLPFNVTASYAVFDTTVNVDPFSFGFGGGVYDGRYLYLVPSLLFTGSGQITRYDTTLSFTSSSSYAVFNMKTNVNSLCGGFFGGVFDGRYIYFAPAYNGLSRSGLIARYDSQGTFTSASNYATFDSKANINSMSRGYRGAIFDGRYVYFVPNYNGNTSNAQILRFDSTFSFTSNSSYTAFNLGISINSLAAGFYGGVFDGRYIYLSPNVNDSTYSGVVARLDAYPGPQATALSISQAPNGFAVGSYIRTNVGVNNLVVPGKVGINTSSPSYPLEVVGIVNAHGAYGYMPGANNQLMQVMQGFAQSGIGGGVPGTNKTMSAASTQTFNTATLLNSNSVGFKGAVFDGRYIYYVPSNGQVAATYAGQITRFDTTGTFGASSSYSVYDTAANINSNSVGFSGALFDGRYIYFVPYLNPAGTASGQITRLDTTALFNASASYAVYDMAANVNANSCGFQGGCFDGRYMYFAPYQNQASYSGLITRYDTTASFTSSSSYGVFDISSLFDPAASYAKGYIGAVFDGRFIYFVPNFNGSSYSGVVTSYDTTGPFNSTFSYAVSDIKLRAGGSAAGFQGAVFDGRYIYYIPNFNGSTYSGTVIQFDTGFDSYAASGSNITIGAFYSTFDLKAVNSLNTGFSGGLFDGRYVYFIPNFNGVTLSGQIARYDTTNPFSISTSYSFFNTKSVQSLSIGFQGAIFDGRYIYLAPNLNGSTYTGQITRIDGYPGSAISANGAASQALNGFTLGTGLSVVTTATSATSGAATLPSNPVGYIILNINNVAQKIPYYNL
ncbi:MAG: hypothetical protein JSS32_06160 [Verrucomicrobia bacterium]|nr:hypothetical protein [Verrucomicrobiota bacterium]